MAGSVRERVPTGVWCDGQGWWWQWWWQWWRQWSWSAAMRRGRGYYVAPISTTQACFTPLPDQPGPAGRPAPHLSHFGGWSVVVSGRELWHRVRLWGNALEAASLCLDLVSISG